MSQDAISLIEDYSRQGVLLRTDFFKENKDKLIEIAKSIAVSFIQGGKLILCGNGGSAADAQHLAAEFVSRFQMERPPLPALALTTVSSVLTAISNDYSFDQIFSKQMKALALDQDVLIVISTSGKSVNVIKALNIAAEKNIMRVALVGRDGSQMTNLCDHLIQVKHEKTPLIQEVHISAGHMLCSLVDYFLFEAVDQLQPYL